MEQFRQRAKELVAKMTFGEKLTQLRYDAPAIDRLGIPAYNWWNEGLHGVARAGAATVFPQAIAMAASFDEALVFDCANAISDEARAKYNEYRTFGDTEIYQGLTYWSPNINIFRDPRWGRGHETYGEDVLLTARLGTAFVKGLQEGKNPDPRYRKLDATLKHYAVHSGPEADRHGFNAEVSEEDLFETYLAAFAYCITHAKPSAVMGAYNRVNGEACCASKWLLQDVLRDRLGFDGYVVSDCGAICDINEHHHLTETAAESAALALNSGCTLNCGSAYQYLKTAAVMGLITEETVTAACEQLFFARFRLGMFDEDCSYDKIPYSVVECDEHRAISRRLAQESIVLLKNDGILPLSSCGQIAVIGPNADDKSVLLGNYNGTPSRYSTLLAGIRSAADSRGIHVRYAVGCDIFDDTPRPWAEQPLREAILAARASDVVVLCMGLNPTFEGEEGDAYNGTMSGDKRDLELPPPQKKLFAEIVKTGKPIVFINVSGSCINLTEQDAQCAAVLQCFYPGAEGGDALADILFGTVSPSGRLPVTFYKSAEDLPPFADYSMKGRTYRFFEGEPLYPFGYGLTYSEIREEWLSERELKLTNCGNTDTGYVALHFAPAPDKRLLDFRRVFLKAGEACTVQFDF